MGIDHFGSIIKGHLDRVHASSLKGKTIAVDVNSCFFSHYTIAIGNVLSIKNADRLLTEGLNQQDIMEEWIKLSKYTINKWESWGINIILVIDGEAPEAKMATQIERNLAATETYNKACEVVKNICVENKLVYAGGCLIDNANSASIRVSAEDWLLMTRYLKASIRPDKSQWIAFVRSLDRDNIKIYQSSVEAETLCCHLYKNGVAHYVFSRDSDCMAYGIDNWLKDWDSSTETFSILNREALCNATGLDESRIQDLCIMLGNDYNTNIPNISTKRAQAILKQQSLDSYMSSHPREIECLNVETCRSIFNIENNPIVIDLKDTFTNITTITAEPSESFNSLYISR